MMKRVGWIVLILVMDFTVFAQGVKGPALPQLPEGLKISYPNSNPLKEALQPVPESAVFKMEGYYLWDP